MRLLKGEKIVGCMGGEKVSQLACVVCRIPAVRSIDIAQSGLHVHGCELQRSVSLCQEHFIEACILFPELQELERHRPAPDGKGIVSEQRAAKAKGSRSSP